jgi:acyl-CoA reductase-like NAD-dependent aldehyde dehydrogenase
MEQQEIRTSTLQEIQDKVLRLADGFEKWSCLPVKKRAERVRELRRIIAKRAPEIARAISEECRRPYAESLAQEVLPVLEMSKYCEKQFPRWLKTKSMRYWRPGFWRKQNFLLQQPLGLVCIITPQNFPFTLGLMSLVYLLMAGNTVILKPSEHSRLVAPLIEELLKEAGFIPDVATVVYGGPQAGEQLVDQPEVKKYFFFGREAGGRAILERCSRLFKPCVLELGGGSTAVVTRNADLARAAAGICWSGFYAKGQSCIGTDRVLLEREISQNFIKILVQQVQSFQAELYQHEKKYGAMESDHVFELQGLIIQAISEGCEVLCGGNRIDEIDGFHALEFTVLLAPSTDAAIFKQEFYGPIIVICPIDYLQKSVKEINSVYPSLGVSIWTKSRGQAISLAKQIQAGMIWVNDSSFGLPCLPWFGQNETGWGRLFSQYSLHEVTRFKWISHHPSLFARKPVWWNPYSRFKEKLFGWAAKVFRI